MMPQTGPEGSAPENTEPMPTETLEKSLADVQAKANSYLAGWQRAQADYVNYKRRCEQEKEEIIKYGNSELITKLLPVLDDLTRAFSNIPAEEAATGWGQGLKMVERKLNTFLENQGVTEIDALGEKFDPNLHEAMMQVDGDEGVVVQQLEKGYKLRDRVIRHARVGVGRGYQEEEKET